MTPPTCTRCGAPITADASFCGQCGAVLSSPQTPPPPSLQPSAVARTAPSQVPSPRRGFRTLPLLILVVGLLAVAAALLLVPRREPPAGETLLGPASRTPTPVVDGGLPPPTVPFAVGTVPVETMPTSWAGASSPPPTPQPEVVPTEPPPPTRTPTPPLVAVFKARKAASFDVSPDDAEVTVDGHSIGKADDWKDKPYKFDGPGSYFVKLSLKGYRTAWIKIVISEDASEKVAEVDTELKEDSGKDDGKVDKKDKKSGKDKKKDKDEET